MVMASNNAHGPVLAPQSGCAAGPLAAAGQSISPGHVRSQRGSATMQISILGGGGFLGRKIATRLATDGMLGGNRVTGLTLFDIVEPPKPRGDFPITALAGDIVELPDAAIP